MYGTISGNVMIRLSLDELNAGTTGTAKVLLAIVALARRRIGCLCAVEKKCIRSADWSTS